MAVRMTHPDGGSITAADDKVRYYEAAGWVVTTEPTAPKRARKAAVKKAPAKKATAKRTTRK